MSVTFSETMAGTFTAPDGSQEPIVFTVTATAEKAKAFITGGLMTVGGICRDAPATGSLEVRLLTDRTLVYQLVFAGDDGSTYCYKGQKDVTPINLLKSMTTLRGTLFREEESVGAAELTFSLRDIPEFMRSFELAL